MKKLFTIRELALIGIFTALTAVLSQVAVPLPFTPVPISFGMVAVYTTGILMKEKYAFFAQLCYLLLGAVGMPVFGNFKGGIATLVGPTGGYLMVYPVMAGIVSSALRNRNRHNIETSQDKSKTKIFLKAALAICVAHTVLYLGGTAWLSAITGNSFQKALAIGVYPYMLLDAVKIVFCVAAIVPLRSRFLSMKLLSLDDAS